MIAVVTILCAFPLGFLLRSRLAACTAYAIAYLWAFTFQTLYLSLDSLDAGRTPGHEPAFVPAEFPWQYGVVSLAIFLGGFGLVTLGHRVGRGRRERPRKGSPRPLPGSIPTGADVRG